MPPKWRSLQITEKRTAMQIVLGAIISRHSLQRNGSDFHGERDAEPRDQGKRALKLEPQAAGIMPAP